MNEPTCPWCRADLYPHCRNGHPTCTWHICRDCKVTVDLAGRHAHRDGVPVDFPHAEPDVGTE